MSLRLKKRLAVEIIVVGLTRRRNYFTNNANKSLHHTKAGRPHRGLVPCSTYFQVFYCISLKDSDYSKMRVMI
jgi:hypothetical protein